MYVNFFPTKGLTSLSEHEKTEKNKIIKNNLWINFILFKINLIYCI